MLSRKERSVCFHSNAYSETESCVSIMSKLYIRSSHTAMLTRCRLGLLDMHFQVVAVALREWIYLLMGVKPGLRLVDIRKIMWRMYQMDLKVISGLGFSLRLH